MRVKAVAEWVGGTTGWKAAARLGDGREVLVKNAHTLLALRRRLRRALEEATAREVDVDEELRIPQALVDELKAIAAERLQLEQAQHAFMQKRAALAQRLLTELNVTEREAADWLGISATRLAKILLEQSTDTTGLGPAEPKRAPRPGR